MTIDAAVVAYTETASGVGELLLGLMPDEQDDGVRHLQLIGRVDTGFSRQERRALADLLKPLRCDSSLHIASRGGHPNCWVRQEIVVETVCHEVLTVNSGEPVRRWRIQHADDNWQPLGKAPSVSLRDAVFVRVRGDKTVALPDVRWGQVGAFARVETATAAPPELPASSILGRFENGRVIQHKRSRFCTIFTRNGPKRRFRAAVSPVLSTALSCLSFHPASTAGKAHSADEA